MGEFITPDGKWMLAEPPEMGWLRVPPIARELGNLSILYCDSNLEPLPDGEYFCEVEQQAA